MGFCYRIAGAAIRKVITRRLVVAEAYMDSSCLRKKLNEEISNIPPQEFYRRSKKASGRNRTVLNENDLLEMRQRK